MKDSPAYAANCKGVCEKLLAPFLFRPFRARTWGIPCTQGGVRRAADLPAEWRACPGLCSHALSGLQSNFSRTLYWCS